MGEWREIDLDLVEGNRGDAVPVASPADVRFPDDPTDGVAIHESSVGPIVVRMPVLVEEPSAPELDRHRGPQPDRVVVEGARGVASVVTPLASGFEHDLVFAHPEVAVASFTVEMVVPSAVVAEDDATGVVLRAGDQVIAHYGGGIAFDAAGAEGGHGEIPVATSLVGQDGTLVTVRVAIDEAWLADPERTFPVTIDPTYTSTIGITSGGGDTYVNQANPTTSMHTAPDLRIGRNTDGNVYRSFVRFGLGGIPSGALIYQAEMRLVNFQSSSCTPALVRARTATSAFGTTTTWSNQPGVGGIVSDSYFSIGTAGCPGGWVTMDATSAVKAWYGFPTSNFGIRLSADEATTAGYKRFYSSEFGSGTAPRLVVTYDRLAPVPTQVAPANGARVPTVTPTLAVNPVVDPDGEPVTYAFAIWSGEGAPHPGGDGPLGLRVVTLVDRPGWGPGRGRHLLLGRRGPGRERSVCRAHHEPHLHRRSPPGR